MRIVLPALLCAMPIGDALAQARAENPLEVPTHPGAFSAAQSLVPCSLKPHVESTLEEIEKRLALHHMMHIMKNGFWATAATMAASAAANKGAQHVLGLHEPCPAPLPGLRADPETFADQAEALIQKELRAREGAGAARR